MRIGIKFSKPTPLAFPIPFEPVRLGVFAIIACLAKTAPYARKSGGGRWSRRNGLRKARGVGLFILDTFGTKKPQSFGLRPPFWAGS